MLGWLVCTVFGVFVFVFVLLNCSCTYNRVHTQGAWLVAVHIRHGEWHTAPRAQIHLLSRKHFAFWQKFHLLPDLLARLPNLIFGEGDFQALLVGESCYCQRGAGWVSHPRRSRHSLKKSEEGCHPFKKLPPLEKFPPLKNLPSHTKKRDFLALQFNLCRQ